MSPFHLTDPTKPGHRRFIALWLVDPHVRIISTANVPPQQLSWWASAIQADNTTSRIPSELTQLLHAKGATGLSTTEHEKLPQELKDMLHENFGEGELLMGEQEAREQREKLMAERSAFQLTADDEWHHHSYSFCEH